MGSRLTKKEKQFLAGEVQPGEQLFEAVVTYRFLSFDDFKRNLKKVTAHHMALSIGRSVTGFIDFKLVDLPKKEGR